MRLGVACPGSAAFALLYTLRGELAQALTTDPKVQAATTEVLPLLAVFNQCDAVVTLCFGIFRGAGLQRHGAILNLFTQVRHTSLSLHHPTPP